MTALVFVVDGVPTSRMAEAVPGATVDGLRSIRVDRPGDLLDIAPSALHDIEAVGLRPMRVDTGDWLTLQDVAKRIGRSREIVRLWSIGAQGPGGFPPPLNPDCATNFYSWVEVSRWIHQHTRSEVADFGDPLLVALNLALQLQRLIPDAARLRAVVECVLGREETLSSSY